MSILHADSQAGGATVASPPDPDELGSVKASIEPHDSVANSDGSEEEQATHSFGPLLRLPNFRNIWLAQLLSQSAHNGIHYVELLMIARLTNSTGHVGLMIIAFTLPAVLFSAVAGIVVDRLPKRSIMVYSNVLRVVLALSYIWALTAIHGRPLLTWVYAATFLSSAIAQFFAPAEGAMIPLIVGRQRLITANSLFNLTMTGTQVFGLMILFPMVIKIGDRLLGPGYGIEFSFAIVAIMYSVAALLVRRLPNDKEMTEVDTHEMTDAAEGAAKRAWNDLKKGLIFVRDTPTLWVPMVNLSMTAAISMILAMMAPNFAKEILKVSQEDAIYIFAPAGVGMLLGTFLIPRFGRNVRRERLSNIGLVMQGGSLLLLGLIARFWEGSTGMTTATMGVALLIGLAFAMIGIPSQTMLQERTPHDKRGRVFSTQYFMANLFSIPIMLFAGTAADRLGLPPIILITAVGVTLMAVWAFFWSARHPGSDPRATVAEA